ncbi:MAG: hypothetical protein KatS3mg083_077 [Candidatus Dojkabacteria bacterium]|nr:MAG: hypothetical protein KatS3mg083_077 [Candidatus Dojkabacteria bacterium]
MKGIFLMLLVLIFIVHTQTASLTYAQGVKFPNNLFDFTQEGERPKKLVLIPVQKYSRFKVSNDKYVQEILHYFSRYSFQTPPIHYVVFSDGSYYVVNDNFAASKVNSNINVPPICIVLVYKDSFQLSDFALGLNNLIKDSLNMQIMNSDIQSVDDIEIRNLRVDETNNALVFLEPSKDIQQLSSVFNNINYKDKIIYNPTVSVIPITQKLPPAIHVEVNFVVQNNDSIPFLFGETMQLKGMFEKDSVFYTSQDWLNTRTVFINKNLNIKPNTTKNITVNFKTPLLPGEYTEVLNIYINNAKIASVPVSLMVDDVGQKVLRIRQVSQWSLSVRESSTYTSREIARVAPGAIFLYTEEKNGFYKIQVSGKEGWIARQFVEILKSS